MRTLVWFRRDLRVRDNTALVEAARASDRGVVGVFLLTPEQWKEHDEAACKVQFWLRNLRALSEALDDRNIPLLIVEAPRFRDVPRKLIETAKRTDCDAVFFNNEYEVNERRRDEAVEEACGKESIAVRTFTDHVVLNPPKVRTKQDGFYSVFTPFRKRWTDLVKEHDAITVQRMPPKQETTRIVRSKVPDEVDGFKQFQVDPSYWPAGEDHARRRLRTFITQHIEAYEKQRDFPAIDGTSMLSPYLAAGVLSPRQCFRAAMDANSGRLDSGKSSIVTWISELIWREFYQHVLVGFPRVSMGRPFKPATKKLRWNEDDEAFQAWKEGRTGYPIVDAAMRQLRKIGWMHNRLRMITAMFLSKNLFLDWRLGERHFMQHLIDGDLGSNNGGWQWSASTGTDAAPYFRIFSPIAQSKRFDPDGSFIRNYVPELAELDAKAIHEPSAFGDDVLRELGYPAPIVDHAATRKKAIAAFKALKS